MRELAFQAGVGLAGLAVGLAVATSAGAQSSGGLFGTPGAASNRVFGPNAQAGGINRQPYGSTAGSGSSSGSGYGYQTPRYSSPTYEPPKRSSGPAAGSYYGSGTNSRSSQPSYGRSSEYDTPKPTYGAGCGDRYTRPTTGEAAADRSIAKGQRWGQLGC